MNRRILVIWACSLLLAGYALPASAAFSAKKKKSKTEQAEKPKPSKYKTTFSAEKGCVTASSSFLTLHKVNGKLYIEIPRQYLGREVLIAATVTGTSDSDVATIGYKARQPLHGRFVERDSSIFLERISVLPDLAQADSLNRRNIHLTHLNPVVWGGEKYFCESDDRQHIVFEATSLFRSVDDLSPLGTKTAIGLTLKPSLKSERSTFDELKAFDDNASVKSTLSYTVTSSLLGLLTVLRDAPVSVQATHTILLLPEQKMRPRLADSRIGTFLTDRRSLAADADKIVTYSVVNRWRLEPRDTAALRRGELSEPVKPIVFYVDNAFPAAWQDAVRRGILRWNKAFEAIGFKDAIRVEPFPTDDPEFDPDNLKYSCVRYVPTAVSNAMGPSWVDPTTGEIINASVIVYNDVAKLINSWRFCQTAQVDERVRAVRMPEEVMSESLEYVLAHEVGHCLGFMHNMSASAAFAVDSLRDPRFTARYGTTPSIMDYARFNYVAQPEDKGVRLTPPDLGVYDYYLVQYAYRPIPEARDMQQEKPVLEGWIEEHAGDPLYRYGRQQTSFRCDPTAIEEDLGDDAVRASDYGVANLKYILAHLDTWIPDDEDADYQHRQELYAALLKQYDRYVQAVMLNIGGIRLYDERDRSRTEAVEAGQQRRAARWVLERLGDSEWIDRTAVSERQPLHVGNAAKFTSETFSDLLDKLKAVVLSSHIAQGEAYTPEEFVGDIFEFVWRPTQANKPLTPTQRMLQSEFVDACVSDLEPGGSTLKISALTAAEAYRPSLRRIAAAEIPEAHAAAFGQLVAEYGPQAIEERMFGKAGYNWQKKVSISSIDQTPALWYDTARRCEKLLAAKAATAHAADRAHYALLLFRLRGALSLE